MDSSSLENISPPIAESNSDRGSWLKICVHFTYLIKKGGVTQIEEVLADTCTKMDIFGSGPASASITTGLVSWSSTDTAMTCPSPSGRMSLHTQLITPTRSRGDATRGTSYGSIDWHCVCLSVILQPLAQKVWQRSLSAVLRMHVITVRCTEQEIEQTMHPRANAVIII